MDAHYTAPFFFFLVFLFLFAWWWSRRHTSSPQSHQNDGSAQPGSADPAARVEGPVSTTQAAEKADAASSTIVVLASGLILGEGIMSIVNLLLASAKVPHL